MDAVATNASDIQHYGRFDLSFYRALDKVKQDIAVIRKALEAEQASALLDSLPFEALLLCAPLLPSKQTATRDSLLEVARAYPAEALALIRKRADEVKATLAHRRAALDSDLSALENLDTRLGFDESPSLEAYVFRTGYVYTIKNPEVLPAGRSAGASYGYALIHTDQLNVGQALPKSCREVEVWVLDEAGRRAPGIERDPVWMPLNKLEAASGFPGFLRFERTGLFEG